MNGDLNAPGQSDCRQSQTRVGVRASGATPCTTDRFSAQYAPIAAKSALVVPLDIRGGASAQVWSNPRSATSFG